MAVEVVGGGLAMKRLYRHDKTIPTQQSHDPAVGGVEEGEDGTLYSQDGRPIISYY